MNPLENLPPFYIGQKVVYITGINMPKDSIHTVRDIVQSECGCWSIKVDAVNEIIQQGLVLCKACNTILPRTKSKWKGFSAESFRAFEESIFPSLTMKRVVEKESLLISMN